MPEPLTSRELIRAYEALGVTNAELEAIAAAPYKQGEELLKKLKQRVSRTYKKLAHELHPDRNGGDQEKTVLFSLVTRAAKKIANSTARPETAKQVPITPITYTSQVAKPTLRVNQRRIPIANGGSRSSREIASRLVKMRP